jgi:hypothetical protein
MPRVRSRMDESIPSHWAHVIRIAFPSCPPYLREVSAIAVRSGLITANPSFIICS